MYTPLPSNLRAPSGQFLPRNCPKCGGELTYAEDYKWGRAAYIHCTELVDPQDDSMPLIPCDYEAEARANSQGGGGA